MQCGLILPNLGALANPSTLTKLAVRAEELRFDGVFASDHLALPTTPGSRYPYRSDGTFPLRPDEDLLEPVTTLAYLAAITTRIKLGFSVLVLPYRHAVLNAKMLSTLDVYSGGRLIVGVGVGWMKEEFEVLDSDYDNRGQVTDEHIRLLQALWRRDEPEFAGTYYRFTGMTMYPKPFQKPHPPIWTGGISRRALRRAAQLSDGWHGVRMTPHEIEKVGTQLRELRSETGRDSLQFDVSLRTGMDLTNSALPQNRLPMRGSPEQVAEDVIHYREAGLTYLVLEPRARDESEFLEQMERFAEEVRPRLT